MHDNEWCKRCQVSQKIIHCLPYGKFVKVYNPDNPRLYTVVAVDSPIMDELLKTNPDRTPRPLPANACCLGGAIIFGGGSKNRSRKKDPKGNKKYQDPWAEV